jgi:hypothetical protein
MITPFFTEDVAAATESAAVLPMPSVVLPGHGPAVRRVGTEWVAVRA